MRIITCVLFFVLVCTVIVYHEQDMDVVKAYNSNNLIKVKAVAGGSVKGDKVPTAAGTVSTIKRNSKNTKWEI
ncbi:MAG: hypothetical protein H0Z40_00615 [Desulfotomaculum sp.]|nr:hypothetical protein [Desulfotomaculum sp.]